MREFDGRAVKTELLRKVLEQLGLKSADELVGYIYGPDVLPVAEIAKISSLVNDPDLGDCVELDTIITKSAVDSIDAYRSVVTRLNLKAVHGLPVVLTGSVYGIAGGRYAQKIMRSIKNITPEATIITPSRTPAEGAIRLALAAQGTDVLPHSALMIVNSNRKNN